MKNIEIASSRLEQLAKSANVAHFEDLLAAYDDLTQRQISIDKVITDYSSEKLELQELVKNLRDELDKE